MVDELYYAPTVYGRRGGGFSPFLGASGRGGGQALSPIWQRLGMSNPYGASAVPGESLSPALTGMARSQFGLPGAGAGAAAPALSSARAQGADYSINTDPVLQQILSEGTQNVAQAEADAEAGRRKALIQFGDPALAAKLLGKDSPLLKSISSDPDKSTSILARINRTYRDRTANDNEQLNAGNLWYGGYRGKVLANDAKDKSTDVADATSNVQNALAQIAATLLGVKTQAAQQQAEAEAQARANQQSDPSAYYPDPSGQAGGADPTAMQAGAGAGYFGGGPAGMGGVSTPAYQHLHGSPTTPDITDALIAAALTSRKKKKTLYGAGV